MPVFEGSRYEGAQVIRVQTAEGVVLPALYSMVNSTTTYSTYATYVINEDDRYDLIAHRLYGDPQLWWLIADLNPEYLYPDRIPGGTVIRVPI